MSLSPGPAATATGRAGRPTFGRKLAYGGSERLRQRTPSASAESEVTAVALEEDALYALAPEDFIAGRDGLAKASAEPDRRRIKALRRPTVAAWLVNQLVRERRESVEELLTLGAELRRAQQTGRADSLRSLGAHRRALTDELVSAAATLATDARRSVTADLLAAVASTLDAAVVDSAMAEQVRSARLTESLSYAGFGAFGLMTVPDAGPAPVPTAGRTQRDDGIVTTAARTGPTSRERAAAERERLAAERAAAAQKRRIGDAAAALAAAHEQRRAAEELFRLTEHALSDARMGLDLARRAEQRAQAALDNAGPGAP